MLQNIITIVGNDVLLDVPKDQTEGSFEMKPDDDLVLPDTTLGPNGTDGSTLFRSENIWQS